MIPAAPGGDEKPSLVPCGGSLDPIAGARRGLGQVPGSSGGAPIGSSSSRHSGSATGCSGSARSTSLSIVSADSSAASGEQAGTDDHGLWNPEFTPGGFGTAHRRSGPRPAGSPATASSPAARAIALLTPLATPAWRTSALASTVAVSGATVMDRPRPNNSDGGEHIGQVGSVRPDPDSQQQPGGAQRAARGHQPARADPLRQRARPRRQQQHQQGRRQQRHARGQRRVARTPPGACSTSRKNAAAQRAVDHEGDHVDRAELAGGEDVQREHRRHAGSDAGRDGVPAARSATPASHAQRRRSAPRGPGRARAPR